LRCFSDNISFCKDEPSLVHYKTGRVRSFSYAGAVRAGHPDGVERSQLLTHDHIRSHKHKGRSWKILTPLTELTVQPYCRLRQTPITFRTCFRVIWPVSAVTVHSSMRCSCLLSVAVGTYPCRCYRKGLRSGTGQYHATRKRHEGFTVRCPHVCSIDYSFVPLTCQRRWNK
jgi:hypothetical protein